MNDKQKLIIDTVTETIDYLSDDDFRIITTTCLAAVQREAINVTMDIKDPATKSKAIAELVNAGIVTLKVED